MARNLYADLQDFIDYFQHSSPGIATADKAIIEGILEAGSRRVDSHCRRRFFAETKTVVMDGRTAGCRNYIWIPDLLSATSIKFDEDGNRTFELTLNTATDYWLVRRGYHDEDALPKTALILDGVNGQRSTFPNRDRSVEIAGRWGYTEAVEDSGQDVPVTGWATGSAGQLMSLLLTGSAAIANGGFAVGQTLKVDNEQLYVQGLIKGVDDQLTVVRGVNGTSPAVHSSGTQIDRYVYEPEVRQAVLILAGRTWKRRETGYANAVANPIVGQVELFRANDPEMGPLLAHLVRGDRLV